MISDRETFSFLRLSVLHQRPQLQHVTRLIASIRPGHSFAAVLNFCLFSALEISHLKQKNAKHGAKNIWRIWNLLLQRLYGPIRAVSTNLPVSTWGFLLSLPAYRKKNAPPKAATVSLRVFSPTFTLALLILPPPLPTILIMVPIVPTLFSLSAPDVVRSFPVLFYA